MGLGVQVTGPGTAALTAGLASGAADDAPSDPCDPSIVARAGSLFSTLVPLHAEGAVAESTIAASVHRTARYGPLRMSSIDWRAEGDRCVSLLQDSLRIPTVNRGTNEPGDGNERPAAERIAEFLRASGVEPRFFEKTRGRTNLVARLRAGSSGNDGTTRGPLLLNAHLDVVEADESRWTHPPFAGEIHDGWLWGRGAIDMKHMAAMSACVVALLAREKPQLQRDLIFAAVADEEAACTQGSLFPPASIPTR